MWSGSTLFLELQRDLNEIFEVDVPVERRFLLVLIQRGIGFLWTLGIGVSLLVLFAFNALWQIVADLILENTTDSLRGFISVGGSLIAFVFMVAVFGLVFQTLTIEKLPWKPVWIGALFTAVIFTLTGLVTGLYIQILGEPSAVGFASSLVVVLFLAYLLSSAFLFGAQVTQSYSVLVFSADRNRLIFSEPDTDTEEPTSVKNLSLSTVAAFFIGLVVGWRNRGR
jgi:membrane protein